MKTGFYPKLAVEGIRKNKRIYFPYILTGTVMVMMFYILSYLTESPALSGMPGGSELMLLLPLGYSVIGIFSLLFLFYTNSFLIRQRYREFGLYNVLGMDKRNISKIMVYENLTVGIIAIVSGLFAGILLSKAAELILLNLIKMEINYELHIGIISFGRTVLVYGIIYFLLLLNSLIKVSRSKPLELMKADKVGERLPKRIWFEAMTGTILLGMAYWLAVSIEEPLAAFTAFFVAVILVIAGTYELFMAGSVVFCKLLQKNKRYYYKPNHFVSVSSMVYRMRRNGAGLASICILLTMVLVMISATTSLYFGAEDAIRTRFPSGVNISVNFSSIDGISDENLDVLRDSIREEVGTDVDLEGYRSGQIGGLLTEDGILIDHSSHTDLSFSTYNNLGYLSVISLADYNRLTGNSEFLKDDECLLYAFRTEFTSDTFTMEFGEPYRIKKVLDSFVDDGDATSLIMPTVYLVVNDLQDFTEPILSMTNSNGEPMMLFDWSCGFDLDSGEQETAACNAIRSLLYNNHVQHIYSGSVKGYEENIAGFFQMYGSLFFLGIMLSVVFLLAAVLIIYYKQISEGYEDQSRFDIMQKVGMTKKDIRRSINSQMLTVFFLPLIVAGIHLCFAFPFIWKILMLFGLNNMTYIIIVMLICFAVFALLYALVYKITSNAYYTIVSGGKE